MPEASNIVERRGGRSVLLRQRRVTSVCLLAVMGLELLARLTGSQAVQVAAWGATCAVAVSAWRAFGMREYYLVAVCVALTLAVALTRPVAVIALALDQASFLMAFILLLGLLHEAAATSPSVAEFGRYLTRQPPGRRYYTLYTGTGVLGVLFNVGTISLLVPLIQRGIALGTPGDALNPVRERRQVSAMLRGFAWGIVWSPTAMAPIAVMELMDGIDRQRWILTGFGIFLVMMVVGALEDRIRFRGYRPSRVRRDAAFPAHAAGMLIGTTFWLLGLALAIMWLTEESVVMGLLAACPLMLIGWLAVQSGGLGARARARTAGRLREIAFESLPRAAPVAVTLAASGYIGRSAASLVPAEALMTALGLESLPDYVLLALIPMVLAVLSLLALSPIVMAVFFGSLFGSLPSLPADPTLIALAISCGWALSSTFSPFATVSLLIDRVGGIPARRLAWRWNLVFSLLSAIALLPVFALLTGGR